MAHCTTVAQLLAAQTERFARAAYTMAEMVQLDAEEGEQIMFANLSGNLPPSVTKGAFARNGMFAKSRGLIKGTGKRANYSVKRGRIPGLPINVQRGRLRSSVRLTKTGPASFDLGASAPYGKFVLSPDGTRKMVARTKNGRPLLGPRGILAQHQRLNNKARRTALQQAHRSI